MVDPATDPREMEATKQLTSAVAAFIETRGAMPTAEILYRTADELIARAHDQRKLSYEIRPPRLHLPPLAITGLIVWAVSLALIMVTIFVATHAP